jgi:DNA-binding NarL/FixJ family response regulator
VAGVPRVLIVDDQAPSRRALRGLLEQHGVYVLGEAAGGSLAMPLAQVLEPDVVLMDLRMPGMNGIEATRRIKEALPLTQVVIVTAYEDPLPEKSAEAAGAYAYLVKGCSAKFVVDVVRHAWRYKAGLELRAKRALSA